MSVIYQPLEGCEATLAGFGKRAIATIRRSPSRGRERFSIAHELGHWEMHRGRVFRCRVDDPDQNLVSDRQLERDADTYASHLLMPNAVFRNAVNGCGEPGFGQIERLAADFNTSLLATSIRLADINTLPIIVACYSSKGLRWYKASADVPQRWWLWEHLDDDSFAIDILNGRPARESLGKQPADIWFENSDADKFEVRESCVPGRNGEVLVTIYLDAEMMEAAYDPEVGNRHYNQFGSYVTR